MDKKQNIVQRADEVFNAEIDGIRAVQSKLDEYFNSNDDYMSELYDVIVGAIVKGDDYFYAYKNAQGRTTFQCADSMGVVEIEARFASDKQEHVLFWYIDRVDKDGKRIKKIHFNKERFESIWTTKISRTFIQCMDR